MTLPTTTGIELELWVIDQSGELADGRAIPGAHPRIEDEFVPCLLEVKTEPHDSESALREDLFTLLRTAIERASAEGLRLVPLGTPLSKSDMPATDPRGRLFEEIYGEGVLAAKNCAGTHIHFDQSNVRRQLNLLTALDPLLSLVSSSPYYLGERNLNCSRAIAYRSHCGDAFRQFCGLRPYVDSIEEWTAGTGRMFNNFCALAREVGVKRSTVRKHFCATDTVLNPVRLQGKQPTVEWRAPDATLPNQVVSLAVDVGTLVAETERKPLVVGEPGVTEDHVGIPEFDDLRQLSRVAIRSGCHEPTVSEFIEAMGVDVEKYDPLSPHIEGGIELSKGAACRARLRQAERLERDLETLRESRATDTLQCSQTSPAVTQRGKPLPRSKRSK